MKASKELVEFVEDLRQEASDVRLTTNRIQGFGLYVDSGKLKGLVAGCRLLIAKLGPYGQVWDSMLQEPQNNSAEHYEKINAVLETIANALAKGRLVTIEEAVSAEVLGELLEHAEELINKKYYLAAAIILRAILEEKLRKLCEGNECMPTVQRPTIETFKQSLHAQKVIDKIGVKDIDWMAGVGNAAAHNLPEYSDNDVPPFYQRVTAFLTRYSLI